MEKRTHTIHTATVNNNCPECFSTEGLEITFTQEEIETKLYSKASKEVESSLICNKCGQQIFPVSWTEDIERVYNYNRKLAKPKSSSFKLKPLAYLLILVDTAIIAFLIYYFNNN
ncbi:MAG: hypothetical protein HKO54_10190 [Flavobacteriaceae bacterium]|nr:hypothetical protein [Flavobacteriaceae bacterium]